MAENYVLLDTGLKNMVLGLTSLTDDKVIKANQNFVKPNLPYMSFQRVTEEKMMMNIIDQPDGINDKKILNTKRVIVRFMAFGDTAHELLDDLVLGQDNDIVMDPISNTYGFNVLSYGPVSDIPTISTNHFEERAVIDMTIIFTTTLTIADSSECVIDDVNGTGTFKDLINGDTDVTFSIDT